MIRSYKEILKRAKFMSEHSIYCKCGHSIALPEYLDKTICTHCGNYVFRSKKDEFNYRMKEQLIKQKRKNEKDKK